MPVAAAFPASDGAAAGDADAEAAGMEEATEMEEASMSTVAADGASGADGAFDAETDRLLRTFRMRGRGAAVAGAALTHSLARLLPAAS